MIRLGLLKCLSRAQKGFDCLYLYGLRLFQIHILYWMIFQYNCFVLQMECHNFSFLINRTNYNHHSKKFHITHRHHQYPIIHFPNALLLQPALLKYTTLQSDSSFSISLLFIEKIGCAGIYPQNRWQFRKYFSISLILLLMCFTDIKSNTIIPIKTTPICFSSCK